MVHSCGLYDPATNSSDKPGCAQGVLYSWILATFRVLYLKNMGMHITTLASDQSSDLALLYILHR